MSHSSGQSDQSHASSRILVNGKPEEGEAKGEGWAAMRSLVVLTGGLIVLSYLIFAL